MTMAHEEYLRRNLLHASAIGSAAAIRAAIIRLEATRRPQRWLLDLLLAALKRADKVHPEMALWRDSAPDSPDSPFEH